MAKSRSRDNFREFWVVASPESGDYWLAFETKPEVDAFIEEHYGVGEMVTVFEVRQTAAYIVEPICDIHIDWRKA